MAISLLSSPSCFNLPLTPLLILPKSSRFHRNPGRLFMKGFSRNWDVIIWFRLLVRIYESVEENVKEVEVVGILQKALENTVDLSGRKLRLLPEAFGRIQGLLVDLSNNHLQGALVQPSLVVAYFGGPKSRATHWKQTVMYLEDRLTICEGETITGSMHVGFL
uniref:Protein arginine N-methyltransferase domain-containing protein n=1 Tax=Brassica oleracea TaxID=3712 RepID=A0A3P6BX69_BRAOL|nr:unnamed protein product [Brassica oleracea]